MTLALLGGTPVFQRPLDPYNPIGSDEIAAANRVIRSGQLSQYLGSPGKEFMGGPQVRAFEEEWATHFNVGHALAVNSWTSGLECAVAALNLNPGDEVVTTPWTMSATAAAIIHAGATPVFVDIEPQFFCIDPEAVERAITQRTRAILAVDIFGQSADVEQLRRIADGGNVALLHDSAQAPGVANSFGWTGCQADIGGFSLNYHKHIHTGEGGMLVTDSHEYAFRLSLLRNHGENLIASYDRPDLSHLVGHNFRMGEVEAAIGRAQLRRLPSLVKRRIEIAERIATAAASLPNTQVAPTRPGNQHGYYVLGLVLQGDMIPLRDRIVDALRAEGLTGVMAGYQLVHRLPMFTGPDQTSRMPWRHHQDYFHDAYSDLHLPVAERLHDSTFIGIEICSHDFSDQDLDKVEIALTKVWDNANVLASLG